MRSAFDSDGNKIAGGRPTRITAHPHQVSLRLHSRHSCGGSIIAANRVLTAARCINPTILPSSYIVLAGTANRTDSTTGQLRTVVRVVRHNLYNPSRDINDIGIVLVSSSFIFNDNVQAIRLPQQNAPTADGAHLTVTGWGVLHHGSSEGFPAILRVVGVPVISNQRCGVLHPGRITPDMLCAGFPQGGRDACEGDIGGPLVLRRVLHGVVSWNRQCGAPNSPGVYTRVSHFVNWIRSN